MSKKRRIYTKEFKKESVRLMVEEGRRISGLSRDLGVGASLLRNWVRQSKVDKIEPFPSKGCLSLGKKELLRLRRENKRLRMDGFVGSILTSDYGRLHKLSDRVYFYLFGTGYRDSSACPYLRIVISRFWRTDIRSGLSRAASL